MLLRHVCKVNAATVLLRLLLIVSLSGFLEVWAQSPPVTPMTVTLSAALSPSAAQPGVTMVNVIGSNFPSGTIVPSQVTVSLAPAPGSTGPALTAFISAVAALPGGASRRITFQVLGPNVSAPIIYRISVSGSTSSGQAFVSGNQVPLTINPPARILSVSPNSGKPGESLRVTVNCQYSNFVRGATRADFGQGIGVSVAVSNATTLTADLTIAAAAATGPRGMTVSTGLQVATLAAGFTVQAGQPALLSINPNSGTQGQANLPVTITGQNTHFSDASVIDLGTGIAVSNGSATDGTHLNAQLSIAAGAAAGARTLRVTTGGEVVTLANAFTVTGLATLLSINPNSGTQGQANLPVTITGQNTHFSNASVIDLGAGITVSNVSATDATHLNAQLSIAAGAAAGARTLRVTTGGEVVTLASAFTVGSAPALLSINPNSGTQGQTVAVAIVGRNTHFTLSSTIDVGPDITATIQSATATQMNARLAIAPAAAATTRTLTVTSGTERVTLAAAFTVQPGGGGSLSISPSSAFQGQSLSVVITGRGISLANGISQARFGPGIAVGGGIAGNYGPITVTSPTTATAQLMIVASSQPGPRTVSVQTGTAVATTADAFAVAGLPYLSSVSPNSARPGQTVTVTIAGVYTHFSAGTTQASFGPGISVGGGPPGGFGPVTVVDSQRVTAQISAGPSAALGVRTPTLRTGTEQAVLMDGFSIFGAITGTPPTVQITSPAEAATVTEPTSVTGVITSPNLNNWTLEYQSAGAVSWTQFAAGAGSAVSGTLDPTLLLNGSTAVRLTATDKSGQTGSASINVVVARNQKVGNFTVSFTDLTVPMAGLPIRVARTYDSRDKRTGDFGVGWTLDIKGVRTERNGPIGDGWRGVMVGLFFPTFCIQQTKQHLVTVTLQDGTTYDFEPVLSPQCQILIPALTTRVNFVPAGATPPTASLSIAGDNTAFVLGVLGPVTLFDFTNVSTFDPDQFRLTLPDGRAAQLSRQAGLQSMRDRNGNTLTITPTGITHSTGKGVAILRDATGRIQQITDPAGNVLRYVYDAAGDLASFTDAESNTSRYAYNTSHGLLTIHDPRGVRPIRNDYDAAGRLVAHTDAFGNVVNYTHAPGTRQEIVTDRRGNVTVNEYDAAGNIVRVTDALGGITRRMFDARGNLLTITDPLDATSTYTYDANNNRLTEKDSLGNLTTYTYNSQSEVTTITDPLGRITRRTFDANGNLQTERDPDGNVTTYTYNSSGLPRSITDPGGGITLFEYDAAGNVIKKTDPVGAVTTSTYDANGNKRTETRTRTTPSGTETLTERFDYDRNNRLVRTTHADGSITAISYSAIGQRHTTTDALGRITSYEYDLMGRLMRTTYADGTWEALAYDEEGNRISQTDRGGRTTTYVYDALNRRVRTIFPDGAATTTTYDAVGQVTAETDQRGNTTRYVFDTAGRRTQTIDALGLTTIFTHDAAGNEIAMTDPKGNTVQYEYDGSDRRTKMTYADSTSEITGYDAMGGIASRTDQGGKIMQYQYDRVGRLIQIRDAAGHATQYRYDEVGNRIAQVDANGRTTAFEYDRMGRKTRRILPLGAAESFTYDAAGNLRSRRDLNGRTTTFDYDLSNRLISKVPDPALGQAPVRITYNPSGTRLSMTDASGVTTYSYDPLDRLVVKATTAGTLTYTYDAAGNLATLRSSNPNGVTTDFSYDARNRLARVVDNSTGAATTYSFDGAGNLAGFSYPNGVQFTYTYDTLNRLTLLNAVRGSPLASYRYTLGAAGNRMRVDETGRQVVYTYDALYRLTGETLSGSSDPRQNGSVTYAYDAVGNRLSRSSSVGVIGSRTYSYDANDRLSGETYDANGNALGSDGNTYTYDFEDRIRTANGAITFVYDGDGNRVAQTAGGVTVRYLIDDRNPTGHPQVLEEVAAGVVQRAYTYGLKLISQRQGGAASFYGYDGHGSVRFLTNASGVITDRYDYDAYGQLINTIGSTANPNLYAGERYEPGLRLLYLRARYLNVGTGRFLSIDPEGGVPFEPQTLHLYVYANADPVNNVDPTGLLLASLIWGQRVHREISRHFTSTGPMRLANVSINTIIRAVTGIPTFRAPGALIRPDLVDLRTREVYEIKTVLGAAVGAIQLAGYLTMLNSLDPAGGWRPGMSYRAPSPISLGTGVTAYVLPTAAGLILYYVVDLRLLALTALLFLVALPFMLPTTGFGLGGALAFGGRLAFI
jgi:RHS repeat-associated protein